MSARVFSFGVNPVSINCSPEECAYLKVSRSLADLRFRELQGESIGKAILRQRLEEVCRRLLTTNDTIENIAARCQFKRVYRLRDAFKAAYGCTMQDWRDSNRG